MNTSDSTLDLVLGSALVAFWLASQALCLMGAAAAGWFVGGCIVRLLGALA